jgi:hypothetical protein
MRQQGVGGREHGDEMDDNDEIVLKGTGQTRYVSEDVNR